MTTWGLFILTVTRVFSFAAGEDYEAISNFPVEFVAEPIQRGCVDITILPDDMVEEDETFVINLVPFDDSVIFEEDQPPGFAQASVTIVDSRKCDVSVHILHILHIPNLCVIRHMRL